MLTCATISSINIPPTLSTDQNFNLSSGDEITYTAMDNSAYTGTKTYDWYMSYDLGANYELVATTTTESYTWTLKEKDEGAYIKCVVSTPYTSSESDYEQILFNSLF